MAAKNNPGDGLVGRTLVITRVFDAPRRLVFKTWIDPVHLEQWWGPEGFTNPVCEADARPGILGIPFSRSLRLTVKQKQSTGCRTAAADRE